MTMDVATRLLCAAHDEWDISEESRALAADALAALKAAEAAARGAAFREREAANEAAMLRAQVEALTAEVARSAEAMRRQAAAVRMSSSAREQMDAHDRATLRSLAGEDRAALIEETAAARRERDDWNARATALESERDALTARAVDAEAEAARRTDEVVAIGDALGREGATAGECVALIGLIGRTCARLTDERNEAVRALALPKDSKHGAVWAVRGVDEAAGASGACVSGDSGMAKATSGASGGGASPTALNGFGESTFRDVNTRVTHVATGWGQAPEAPESPADNGPQWDDDIFGGGS